LERHAILLSLGEELYSTTVVDIDIYKVALTYTDADGDKVRVTSKTFPVKGTLKIFAFVQNKKDEQISPELESAGESLTQTVHSPTSLATVAAHEIAIYIVKLALVGSGCK
jgi:hypothetical protein